MFHKTKEDKTEEKEQEWYIFTSKIKVQYNKAATRLLRQGTRLKRKRISINK